MKKALIAVIAMLAFWPAGAGAQERAGDAALGAVSGAIVLGPVGAVAGAFVGYAAGPSIARSWGLRGSRAARRERVHEAARSAPASAPMDANDRVAQISAPTRPAPAPSPARSAAAPPVQGFE